MALTNIISYFVAAASNASNVRLDGLTGNDNKRSVRVSWDPPINLQFDVAYYRVEVLVDESVRATGNSTSNMIDLEVPFSVQETFVAQVYTVSRCGDEAGPMRSIISVSSAYTSK